jgi:hypothetical protein
MQERGLHLVLLVDLLSVADVERVPIGGAGQWASRPLDFWSSAGLGKGNKEGQVSRFGTRAGSRVSKVEVKAFGEVGRDRAAPRRGIRAPGVVRV